MAANPNFNQKNRELTRFYQKKFHIVDINNHNWKYTDKMGFRKQIVFCVNDPFKFISRINQLKPKFITVKVIINLKLKLMLKLKNNILHSSIMSPIIPNILRFFAGWTTSLYYIRDNGINLKNWWCGNDIFIVIPRKVVFNLII